MKVYGKDIKDFSKEENRWLNLQLRDSLYHMLWGKYWPLGTLKNPVPKSLNS